MCHVHIYCEICQGHSQTRKKDTINRAHPKRRRYFLPLTFPNSDFSLADAYHVSKIRTNISHECLFEDCSVDSTSLNSTRKTWTSFLRSSDNDRSILPRCLIEPSLTVHCQVLLINHHTRAKSITFTSHPR